MKFSSIRCVLLMTMLHQIHGEAPRRLANGWSLSEQEVNDLLKRTNDFRAQKGLAPLLLHMGIMGAAQELADEMASSCQIEHTDVAARLARWGVEGMSAENTASGQVLVEDVMSSWIDSDQSRNNLLSEEFRIVGFGYAFNGSCNGFDTYWVQDFCS